MSNTGGLARAVCLAVGTVYLLIGILGFAVTGFGEFSQNTSDNIAGFDLNPFHNLVHLAVGAYLLLVTMLGTAAMEGALIGGGAVYLLAAILGFGDHMQILSINASGSADNFLHLVSGAAALAVGLLSAAHTASVERRESTA